MRGAAGARAPGAPSAGSSARPRWRCSESPRRSARWRSARRGGDERGARLERAQANLQESLRTAGVLAGAAGEVYASYRRVRRYHARQVTRVAAIDIGTNSTRLLVADVEGARIDEVVRRSRRHAARRGRRRVAAAPARADRRAPWRRSRTTGASSRRSARSERSRSRRAPFATPRTAGEFLAEVETRFGFATRLLDRRRGGRPDPARRRCARRRPARRRRRRRLDRADPRRAGGRASTSARCG